MLDLHKKFEYNDFASISGVKALKIYLEKKYENNMENSDKEPDLSDRRKTYNYFKKKRNLY